MNTTCPYCGHPSPDYRHAAKCVMSPRWKETVTALLDSGTGHIREIADYDANRGAAPCSRSMINQFGSWRKVAESFGLRMSIRKARVRHDPLNAPLTWEERNACKLRAQMEGVW